MSFLDKISAGLLCMVFATGISPTIILNPNKISEIDSLDVDIFIKERLKNYINERENKFSFDDKESEYKFYILNNPIELVNEIALPNQNNQSYFHLLYIVP